QPVPPTQNRLPGQPSAPAGSGGDSKAPMVPDPVVPNPGLPASALIPEDGPVALNSSWSDGLRFSSHDGAFHVHVSRNVRIDATWFMPPNSAFALKSGETSGIGNANAVFLRRVRFRIDGDIWDQFDFSVEYDLANANNETNGLQPPSFGNIAGAPAPCNIWMQVRDVPLLGNVRFGNIVKPIGMTNNTSQAMLPFIERPDNMDAFYGPFDSGFALGLVARNHTDDERVTWQYGIYRPAINVFGVALNKSEWGGRVTGLPVYQDD